MPPKKVLTTEDVARLAGTSVDYIRKARRRGVMPPALAVGRQWVWDADEIDEWIEARRRGPGRPLSEKPSYSPPKGQPWVIGVMPGTPRVWHVIVANEPANQQTLCYLRGPFGGTKEGPDLDALGASVIWPMCKACAKRLGR